MDQEWMLCHGVQSAKKTHTSHAKLKSALQEVQRAQVSLLEVSMKKMKNGLNNFPDFQTFKNLLLIYFHINNIGMHSFSITPGLKTLCYYGNGHFSVHQGQCNIKTVCIELQTGGTER